MRNKKARKNEQLFIYSPFSCIVLIKIKSLSSRHLKNRGFPLVFLKYPPYSPYLVSVLFNKILQLSVYDVKIKQQLLLSYYFSSSFIRGRPSSVKAVTAKSIPDINIMMAAPLPTPFPVRAPKPSAATPETVYATT